jgi:hypothetical protein
MRMGWVLRLVETGVDGSSRSVDVLEIIRPGDLGDLANRGLSVAAYFGENEQDDRSNLNRASGPI